MPSLAEIKEKLEAHDSERLPTRGDAEAAVAIVLREVEDRAEVLFIERATHEGDPWSGHMAFPGGRRDPGDVSTRAAAQRETFEEVGVSIERAAYWGLLGEMVGGPRQSQNRLVVSAHVFHVSDPEPFALNYEVREAFWFPVGDLLDTERHVAHSHLRTGDARFPGILIGEPQRHVVWGLTYRFLEVFLRVVGRPLPERWAEYGVDRRWLDSED